MARRVLVVLGVAVAVIVGGNIALDAAGIDNSPQALRAWVESTGWWAPVIYVALLAFRHFLLLPSTVMLTIGGALFGALGGGVTGSAGLFASAMLEFWMFRNLRPGRLMERFEEQAGSTAVAVERGTPLAVFASTAVPPAPMTFVYWAASLTSMSMAAFAAHAGLGGVVRAFALSLLGAGIVTGSLPMLGLAAAVCLALLGVFALSPRLRAALLPPLPAKDA